MKFKKNLLKIIAIIEYHKLNLIIDGARNKSLLNICMKLILKFITIIIIIIIYILLI